MTVYAAVADFGWTPGADVSQLISDFFAGVPNAGNNNQVASAGDTLHLDSATRFDIDYGTTGEMAMPNNFTLSAVNGGGFNIDGPDGAGGLPTTSGNSFFEATSGCYFLNLTVRATRAPSSGYTGNTPAAGTDHDLERFITLNAGAHNVIVRNCDFEGQIEQWLDIRGGGASSPINDLLIEGCRFYGGKYQVYMLGNVYRPRFRYNYFEYGMIDSIKSVLLNTSSPTGWIGTRSDGSTVNSEFNHFKDTNRDCYDLTGGGTRWILQDDIPEPNYLDIKHPIKDLSDPATDISSVWNPYSDYGCIDMTINRVHFLRSGNCVTITNDTPTGDVISISDYNRTNPRNISFNDCIWDITAGSGTESLIFLKGGDNISVTNLAVRGYTNIQEFDLAYASRLGTAGYPPSGWSPTVAPSADGTTTSATNTSPLPTLGWSKVGIGSGLVFTTGGVPLLIKPGGGLGRLI